jgi:hypothetical protein
MMETGRVDPAVQMLMVVQDIFPNIRVLSMRCCFWRVSREQAQSENEAKNDSTLL